MNVVLHILLIALIACGNVQLFQPVFGPVVPVAEERTEEVADHAKSSAAAPAPRPGPPRTRPAAVAVAPRLERLRPANVRATAFGDCTRRPLRC